ncbi:hypothetical protein [Smaragdicoccus niigatensis]|uniref:hypothetical protein n=1 Tax=Smaragdicoccus niigatensis TaxID=359359 RepID=UPI000369576C|nr:hypothetical protein [Smaragdicoccus niigatensis]
MDWQRFQLPISPNSEYGYKLLRQGIHGEIPRRMETDMQALIEMLLGLVQALLGSK